MLRDGLREPLRIIGLPCPFPFYPFFFNILAAERKEKEEIIYFHNDMDA